MDAKDMIAKRIAQELKNGMLVNLGVGIPGKVLNFVPPDIEIIIHSENGIIGSRAIKDKTELDPYCADAGNFPCAVKLGGAIVDSATSFGIIRGGHLDCTVLGALQVDQEGSLANWIVPGGKLSGMGGAMDLTVGAKKVIAALEHCAKDGKSKIKKTCTYPLTGYGVVDQIVTELAVIEVTAEGLVLVERASNASVEEIIAKTEAALIVSNQLKVMNI